MIAIAPAITSIIATITSAIVSVSQFVVTYGPKIVNAINTVCGVIDAVMRIFGIFTPKENAEEIGDRALQAAEEGIKPENFDSYDDYLATIRSFEIDPEKSKQFSQIEKQLTGLGIAAKGMEGNLDLREGTIGDLCVKIAQNSGYFTEERITSWLKSEIPLEKILDYFNSKLDAADTVETEVQLIEQEKTLTNQSETDIEKTLNQIREEIEQQN